MNGTQHRTSTGPVYTTTGRSSIGQGRVISSTGTTGNVRYGTPSRAGTFRSSARPQNVRVGSPVTTTGTTGTQGTRVGTTGGRVVSTTRGEPRTISTTRGEPRVISTTEGATRMISQTQTQAQTQPRVVTTTTNTTTTGNGQGRIISTTRMEPRVISTTRIDREPKTIAVNRIEKPVIVHAPAPAPVVKEVVVQAPPAPAPQPVQIQAPPANRSTIRIDDEERYRTVANEMHGYGRNNIKSRVGNSNMTYSKRTDLRNKDYIVSGKGNTDKYRNDPACTLI